MTAVLHEDPRIAATAAEWLITLDEEGDRHEEDFAAWLGESPRHVEEFLFASSVCAELRACLRGQHYDAETLVAEARTGQDINVVPLDADLEPRNLPRVSRGWLLAACLAVLTMTALGGAMVSSHSNSYETGLGEQRALGLPDGSVVHLNTQSRVKVRFSDAARDIQLTEGEALFQVAPDPVRPFRVHAGDTVIQAMGTRFNVYRRGNSAAPGQPAGDTTVSVIEGSVRISRDGAAPSPATSALRAGDQVRVTKRGQITTNRHIDTARIDAWRQRRLVFADDRLADIAAEFNRYNRTPKIEVDDDAAADTRMSGVFDADDPDSILLFVSDLPGLAVDHRGDTAVIRTREPETNQP